MIFANRRPAYKGVDRRVATPSVLFIVLSALVLAGIAFATLCPVSMRPHLATANQERFGAYFLLGFVLALTAPRRWALTTAFVVVLAFTLEAAQLLIPTRDAVFQDAVVKALGGAAGAGVGYLTFPLKRLAKRLLRPALDVAAQTPQD